MHFQNGSNILVYCGRKVIDRNHQCALKMSSLDYSDEEEGSKKHLHLKAPGSISCNTQQR